MSAGEEAPAVREARKRRVDGQFFLCCSPSGLCGAFTDSSHFYTWFTNQALRYLDFEGRSPNVRFNPHFLRAMYGDWLRFDLGFSSAETADMAADTEKVFESAYITHPTIFDATESWTRKNKEIRALRGGEQEGTGSKLRNEVIMRHDEEMTSMQESMKSIAESMKKLSEKSS